MDQRNRNENKKEHAIRFGYYVAGMLILALGIILNTETGLGVSPIVSVPYCIAYATGFNFGNMTLVIYCVFVAMEFLLKGKQSKLYDLLQIPVAIVFTRFMNFFANYIHFSPEGFAARLALLIVAIILTGIGAAMSLNMRLIPNPGDGIVQVIADTIHKDVGFTKNCFDVLNIVIAITVSLLCTGKIVGVGVGTVIAMFGVGRAIAAFNHMAKDSMERNVGLR